jgi:hypothetical protein
MRKFLISTITLFPSLEVYAHGISDADKLSMIEGGYFKYIELGASHMITGYDHLLFLFGVIFFLTKFRDIIKFITAFTLGHSITLIFATFMGITANYFLIDALIAITVIYKGFDNLDGFRKYLDMKAPNLLMLVFIFGLVHGFGLSTRLQQLPLGNDGLLGKIISFNVGVELGQVLALSIMLALLSSWRKSESFSKFSKLANSGIIVAGIGLFSMQMHGFSHHAYADEMGFSIGLHNDAHLGASKKGSNGVVAVQTVETGLANREQWEDEISLTLAGGESLEYKFHIEKGQILNYSWQTNHGKLFFDFHGEPKGDSTGYFKSFKKGTESKSSGSLESPFDGAHGWYWKNRGLGTIRVTLKTKGRYKILGIR